ncbi:MAG TPA: phospholipase D family protein [Gammaproteobacteria bacterium]|nr:phospholipase D family protein [Gammaproteobacteria bacterium]
MRRYLPIPVFVIGACLMATGVCARGQARHREFHPCVANHPPPSHLKLSGVDVTLIFSPQGGGENLIVQALDAAQHTILVQAYSFTDRHILDALARAARRGVAVSVILDRSDTERYHGRPSVAERIAAMNIPVWIDDTVETAHNKVLVLDDSDVITGSYNFSYAADRRNAENLLYLRHAPELVRAYTVDWEWRRDCSRRYRQ